MANERSLRAAIRRGIKEWANLCDLRYEEEGVELILTEIKKTLLEHGEVK